MNQQQRHRYCHALKLPVWVSREVAIVDSASEIVEPVVTPQAEPEPANQARGPSPVSSMLRELEKPTTGANPPVINSPAAVTSESVELADTRSLDWQSLQQAVQSCQRCGLHATRTQTVFGTGDQQATWMIIGEAPGADEDRRGEPFVGRAGQLLNNMLKAIQLPRESVYIANILKCRPPNNRDPRPEEATQCMRYLHRQIELVDPAVILVVGRIAAQNLLGTQEPLGRMRNRHHQLPGLRIPVVVTYHPAYLLRQPQDKRKAWEDLLRAKSLIRTDAGH